MDYTSHKMGAFGDPLALPVLNVSPSAERPPSPLEQLLALSRTKSTLPHRWMETRAQVQAICDKRHICGVALTPRTAPGPPPGLPPPPSRVSITLSEAAPER
jgi:hypothetical protein